MWLLLSKSHECAGNRSCQRMVSDFEKFTRHICHAPLAMGTFRSPLARLSYLHSVVLLVRRRVPPKSLGGREEVSLTPMQSSRPEMPLSGIRLTWISRNSPIHHLLGLSIFAACLIRSYIGYVPEMPSMKLSSSTLGECSSLNG